MRETDDVMRETDEININNGRKAITFDNISIYITMTKFKNVDSFTGKYLRFIFNWYRLR